jgi:MFS family permease
MADPDLNISHTEFGYLQASVSLPNVILPFLGGIFLDIKGTGFGAVVLNAIVVIGHLVFVIFLSFKNFVGALIGRCVYGLALGSLTVAQGKLVAETFSSSEIGFAVGICESVHALSQFLAKIPLSPLLHGYQNVLFFHLGICCLSLLSG